MQEDEEILREFLVESHENLSRLDQDMVELETRPQDSALLASVFRTIHTIKGTCGFLGFSILEKITHRAESLLSLLRDGKCALTPQMVSLILETVDATRSVLASIETSGDEGADSFDDLVSRLESESEKRHGETDQVHAEDDTPQGAPAQDAQSPQPLEAGPLSNRRGSSKAEEETQKSSAAADSNIRVGVGLLDNLMDLVGELVLTRNQIVQFATEREDPAMNGMSQRLNLITSQLQENVMKTRMQPIGTVWNKLPRVVRDLAVNLGKQIRLEMDGTETELDRTIIEAIKDPLVHLVRNACDHGIEPLEEREHAGKSPQGTLLLRAYHEGGQVNIEISDDGAGIDPARIKRIAVERGILSKEAALKMSARDALNLIFSPGFSTAATVTSVSGRGVGMDVVKTHIEKIGGIVDVSSRPGEGTTVKLKIPLTLAIIPGLVVSSGNELFVIPQVSLLELVRLEGNGGERRIEYVHGTPVYRRRGSLLPIAYLNQVLGLGVGRGGDAVNMVVLQVEDRQFGLVVDSIYDTQEIVVKPLGKQLKGLSMYAGATIMGDGKVALILDVLGIGERSGVLAHTPEQMRAAVTPAAQLAAEAQSLLLFRAGPFERIAVPLSLVARLEEFPAAQIERASGEPVLQYRSRILPLVHLHSLLEPETAAGQPAGDPLQVIVFRDGDRSLGVVVDQILDVVEEMATVRQKASRRGFLGSAVVAKRVADFLDLDYVLAASAAWSQRPAVASKTVLVAEPSAFARAIVRNRLEMAGYAVLEAASLEEAVHRLEQYTVDAVLVAHILPPGGSSGLKALLRHRSEWQQIPVLDLDERVESGTVAGMVAEGLEAPMHTPDDLLVKLARLPGRAAAVYA